MSRAKKLYAYVDESGQDTEGRIFVVGVVVLDHERDVLAKELERIEERSGKRTQKWNGSRFESRRMYFEHIACMPDMQRTLFFEIFTKSKKYIEMTSYTTAKAILKKAPDDNYSATIFIDGFRKQQLETFVQGLRDLHIKRRKVRGVKKEESNAFIRLADAFCGLVRDAEDGEEWASAFLRKIKKDGIVTAL